MEIGFNSVNRMNLPPPTGVAGGVPSAKSVADDCAAEVWKTRETGAEELAKVAGEEAVDEAALRRDDDLGKLMSKVFDPASAAAALPPLGDLSAV